MFFSYFLCCLFSYFQGERFLQQLVATAQRLGMRKGALSRAVLPFDDQTSLADQSDLANRTGHSLEAKALLDRGALDPEALADLSAQVCRCRVALGGGRLGRTRRG